ncbi:DUF1642 domain-containing protein [Enterococcus casseliflavus]|uniref:DUF1642 domain-containing protein n=1 Tax=Enterococcus casseliflavus TaxID=37734 RepID=A0ABD6YYM3_ENTCA|nr:DUF1642 domain-containing protein [Enterococcus casseliflavus]QGN29161.1 DUF1642 domain-containing protein [Enterococcus casseliflavus]
MNKQELIEMVKNAEAAAQEGINLIRRYKDEDSDYQRGQRNAYRDVATWIEEFDEQPKVTVPKFVADWIKQCKEKATLADCLDGYYEISNGEVVSSEDFQNWVVDNENDELTAKAWIFGYEVEKLPVFPLSQGDLVIRKGKHEAKIYIVESVSESGVLLVNGIKDEFYSVDDEGGPDNDLDYFYSNFRLLAKKESLEVGE